MLGRWLSTSLIVLAASGCSTPYEPPVMVHGGSNFDGLADVLRKSGRAPVDVVLVHGMCTHDEGWAHRAIDMLTRAIEGNVKPDQAMKRLPAKAGGIQTISRTVDIAGGTVRFSALVWSPLTTPLKQQLHYDSTAEPTDCTATGECKPIRAKYNGVFKDGLLNDCLADAVIYQGRSRLAIRKAMMDAISNVVQASEASARSTNVAPGPLVVVSESLGSKLTFDALDEMTREHAPADLKVVGNAALSRLALVFMGANQLPILGLADQDSAAAAVATDATAPSVAEDSLQRILNRKLKRSPPAGASMANRAPAMTLVAFTDPNDLLSYRLQPSRYQAPGIAIADVLVSNAPTYFGLLERPDKAHVAYRTNASVATLIACGKPKSQRCR